MFSQALTLLLVGSGRAEVSRTRIKANAFYVLHTSVMALPLINRVTAVNI